MNYKLLAVLGLFPLGAQAEYIPQKNSSFSIGYSQLMLEHESEKERIGGVGLSGISFKQSQNIGFAVSLDYFNDDISDNTKAEVWDITIGPAFRFDELNWLRVYPLAGAVFSSIESCQAGQCAEASEIDFTFGAGAQLLLGDSGVLVDINYKKVNMAIDSNMLFLGVGYAF